MESEKRNKISVKDIADKLKLREFCSGSSDWQIESSGKRTQIAQDLLDRLESDKEVTYVSIDSAEHDDKDQEYSGDSYYLCSDETKEFINNWIEVQNEIFKAREEMCNSSIVKHYYDYHYKLTKIINKIDKPSYEGYTKSDLAGEFEELSDKIDDEKSIRY